MVDDQQPRQPGVQNLIFGLHQPSAIARRDRESNDPSEYWSAWQDALEDLMLGVGVIQSGEINRRAGEFAQHSAHGD